MQDLQTYTINRYKLH